MLLQRLRRDFLEQCTNCTFLFIVQQIRLTAFPHFIDKPPESVSGVMIHSAHILHGFLWTHSAHVSPTATTSCSSVLSYLSAQLLHPFQSCIKKICLTLTSRPWTHRNHHTLINREHTWVNHRFHSEQPTSCCNCLSCSRWQHQTWCRKLTTIYTRRSCEDVDWNQIERVTSVNANIDWDIWT